MLKFDYSKLQGRIKEVCGTQAVFALEMRLSERTISLKLNGVNDWRQGEIERACKVLNISPKEISSYFFTLKVQN